MYSKYNHNKTKINFGGWILTYSAFVNFYLNRYQNNKEKNIYKISWTDSSAERCL